MVRINIMNTEHILQGDSPTAALNEFFKDLSDDAFTHTWEHVADLPGGGISFQCYVNGRLASHGTAQQFDRRSQS